MKPPSQRALLWLGFILLIIGSVVLSPLAALLLAMLALLCALPGIFLSAGKRRWFGLILLISTIVLGSIHFEKGSHVFRQYQQRGKN